MEKFYNVTQFAELINMKVKTLQKWDREGILKSNRTPTNRRYYTHSQYLDFIGQHENNLVRQNVIYSRVSNKGQKDDLLNQNKFIYSFTSSQGINISKIYTDIGSGLNYNRKQWNELIHDCLDGKISKIFISHKDRFVRFGFDWFTQFLKKTSNTDIVVIENETTSPENELVKDLISIIHVFSCRVYGLRKYKSKISKGYNIGDDNEDH